VDKRILPGKETPEDGHLVPETEIAEVVEVALVLLVQWALMPILEVMAVRENYIT
jgi:hypothetical protein